MKYIYTFLVILLIQISFTSCQKFLETKPTDFLSPESYYNTESKLTSSLAGVYDILGTIYGSFYLYRYGVDGDQGYYNGGASVSPEAYNVGAGDQFFSTFWKNLYDGINKANILLANVNNNTSIRQEFRNQVRGEALFLRAYYYSLLVETYGGVPLILKPVTSANDVDVPRATAKDTYEQVIKDMIEAEALVPKINVLGYGGRVTKSAARGVLARVCLHMAGEPVKDISKYAEARKWAKMVMDDTEAMHELNPKYSQIFINYAADKYDVKESLWEVEFYGSPGTVFVETGQNGAVNGPVSTNPETGVCNGTMRIVKSFYDLFEPGDQRRDWNIANFTYNATGLKGSKTFLPAPTPATLFSRYSAKYRREYEASLPNAKYASSQNYPLLRYADVLLMFAEAEFELNGATQEAVDAVNLVRKRAWSTGIRSISITAGGNGYTTAPSVIITDGGGNGAIATATVAGGKVTGVVFTSDDVTGVKAGEGYTSVPTITFSGGGGTGAAATASIYTDASSNVTPSQIADFRNFIQDERSRELCFEGLRRLDLIRTGKFVATMNTLGNAIIAIVPTAIYAQRFLNVTDKHVIWPIPSREISLNRALIQNQGW